MTDYGLLDLADAFVDAPAGKSPGRRYEALSWCLEVDLRVVPASIDLGAYRRLLADAPSLADGPDLDRRDAEMVHQLLVETLGTRDSDRSPFASYLEAPLPIVLLHQRHGERLDLHGRTELAPFVLSTIELLYGVDRSRTATREHLTRVGWEPTGPPVTSL